MGHVKEIASVLPSIRCERSKDSFDGRMLKAATMLASDIESDLKLCDVGAGSGMSLYHLPGHLKRLTA